jgi:CheY-like chemotaxis protein
LSVDSTTPAHLFLVDDDRDNLEILTVILSEKYRVSSYSSGAEALRALEAVRPDLVLLDIGMTPLDGLECIKAIRAMPGYARIPAIALTAFAREVERKSFLAAGFHAVITKPLLDHRALFTLIDSLLAPAAAPSLAAAGAEARGGRPVSLTTLDEGGMMGRRGWPQHSTPEPA